MRWSPLSLLRTFLLPHPRPESWRMRWSTEAPAKVRAHEMEHVSNAYSKAQEGNGKVLQASVTLHTAICPECGRAYVSGGETRTAIQYKNESNPYQKNLKSMQADAFRGANVDLAV